MRMAVGKESAGCSNRSSSEAAAEESTGGVALGYVEDDFEGRTKLGACFIKVPAERSKRLSTEAAAHEGARRSLALR